MLAQRTIQNTLRRAAVRRSPLVRNAAPAAMTTTQARFVASSGDSAQGPNPTAQGTVAGGASEELIQQRLRRPTSPHLGIYQPQITWIPSILNRMTGLTLSGGFYVFGFGYLVAPMFGWHLESATLAAAFGSLGLLSKSLIKFTVALPFTFHSLNGIRHLMWDTGAQLSNKQVQITGWTMIGSSVALAAYLASIGGS